MKAPIGAAIVVDGTVICDAPVVVAVGGGALATDIGIVLTTAAGGLVNGGGCVGEESEEE